MDDVPLPVKEICDKEKPELINTELETAMDDETSYLDPEMSYLWVPEQDVNGEESPKKKDWT
jgi:hypothetical protein